MVQPFLNAVVDSLPTSIKVKAIKGINERTKEGVVCKLSNKLNPSLHSFSRWPPTPFVRTLTDTPVYFGIITTPPRGNMLNLAAKDPTFWFSRNKKTGQTIIEELSKLHLKIIVNCMIRVSSTLGPALPCPRCPAIRPSRLPLRLTTPTRSSLSGLDSMLVAAAISD